MIWNLPLDCQIQSTRPEMRFTHPVLSEDEKYEVPPCKYEHYCIHMHWNVLINAHEGEVKVYFVAGNVENDAGKI